MSLSQHPDTISILNSLTALFYDYYYEKENSGIFQAFTCTLSFNNDFHSPQSLPEFSYPGPQE